MRRTVWVVAAALIVLGGAGVALAVGLRSPSAQRPSVLRAGKLSVSVPRGFSVYNIRGGHLLGARAPVVGRVLTNFRLPAHTTWLRVLDQWAAMRGNGPPSDEVALILEPGETLGPDKLHLPLSLKQPWDREHFADRSVGGYRVGFLRFAASDYEVIYWSGTSAPERDRAAVLRALRSIRPAR